MITTTDTRPPSVGTLVGDVLAASDRDRLALLDRLAAEGLGLRCDDAHGDIWTVVPATEPGALVAPGAEWISSFRHHLVREGTRKAVHHVGAP